MGNSRNGPLSGSWARVWAMVNSFAAPSSIHDDTNTEGSATSHARSDHVHAHGGRGGGTLHALAQRDIQDDDNNRDGFQRSYQDLRRRRLAQVTAARGTTTLSATHMPTPTLTANSVASNTEARGDFVVLTTNTTSGNAGTYLTTAFTQRNQEPAASQIVRIGPTSDVRIYHGLFSADPSGTAPSGLAGAGISCIAFAYDSTVHGDGLWRIIVSNGSSQTTTVAAAAIASGRFALDFECDDLATDEVRFYIDSALEATETANLPGTGTALLWASTLTNLSTVSKNMRMGILSLTKSG